MNNSNKPTGAASGWRVLESQQVFEEKTFVVLQDRVRVEKDGRSTEMLYAHLERAEAVLVVPVTREGEVILIRQYRYPVDEWCWEVPAGGTGDTGGMPLEDVVRKELEEETGATCGAVEYVSWFYSAMAFCDEKCHVFLARDVQLSSRPHTEPTESLEVRLVALEEALRMARQGEMKSGPCALALLMCEGQLRSLEHPAPQAPPATV